jgi:hypothetical protein
MRLNWYSVMMFTDLYFMPNITVTLSCFPEVPFSLIGGFLIGRTLAVLTTMTLATSMVARQGAVAMAAHQICMQIWLAVSLLTDALASSGQVQLSLH